MYIHSHTYININFGAMYTWAVYMFMDHLRFQCLTFTEPRSVRNVFRNWTFLLRQTEFISFWFCVLTNSLWEIVLFHISFFLFACLSLWMQKYLIYTIENSIYIPFTHGSISHFDDEVEFDFRSNPGLCFLLKHLVKGLLQSLQLARFSFNSFAGYVASEP